MAHKLLLASAGAGKSELIAKEALARARNGSKVLLLTYTKNNQAELVKTLCRLNKMQPQNVVVKGWFSFLLEDMVRPYQRCIVNERVAGICFNSSNPHLVKRRFHIPGRSEKVDGRYNPLHFLTRADNAAHTFYLSKLAVKVAEETDNKPSKRLAEIYSKVFIDEVQDLVGWDFEVIKGILDANMPAFECVGDFRQTIYQTSEGTKKPTKNGEKLAAFKAMGFELEQLNISWRCIQSICDFADRIHAVDGHYAPTVSKVDAIPAQFADHHGIFAVRPTHVNDYLARYNPVILRWNMNTKKSICEERLSYNFGEAKGIGFERVFILPTEKHTSFLCGHAGAFDGTDSDGARNKLYVGMTRAKYSVAILHDCKKEMDGAQVWSPDG